MTNVDGEKVGHKNPPKHTRFRKGESGNPRGRPRKPKTASAEASAFDVLVDRTLTVTKDGIQREISVEEALQHQIYRDALAGKRAAQREVLKMIAKREAALAKKRSAIPMRPVTMGVIECPRNADEALVLLGIASDDPPLQHVKNDPYRRLHLEPWAVQMALSRRRGGTQLTEQDKTEVKRCTRKPETLRWPRKRSYD